MSRLVWERFRNRVYFPGEDRPTEWPPTAERFEELRRKTKLSRAEWAEMQRIERYLDEQEQEA